MNAQALEATAKRLRSQPTASEALLRDTLAKRGYRFSFNQTMCGYIPDYFFPDHQKIVELDGAMFHDADRDARRDAFFASKGINTLRIRSHRVFVNMRSVLRSIEVFLGTAAPQIAVRKKSRPKQRKTPNRKRRVLRLTKDHLPKKRRY